MSGTSLIEIERQRQINDEGYDANHDAGHAEELALAGACYAIPESARSRPYPVSPYEWPWSGGDWKPTPNDRIRELVKAGALIAAAIDALSGVLPTLDAALIIDEDGGHDALTRRDRAPDQGGGSLRPPVQPVGSDGASDEPVRGGAQGSGRSGRGLDRSAGPADPTPLGPSSDYRVCIGCSQHFPNCPHADRAASDAGSPIDVEPAFSPDLMEVSAGQPERYLAMSRDSELRDAIRSLPGACHDGEGLGCESDPCVENVSRAAVLAILDAAASPPRPASLLARRLSKIDPADLIPTGEHRLIDGYCPDCSGSCLVGFGNPSAARTALDAKGTTPSPDSPR
jgi:hypothetical protein